jgi:hypothetical protein
MHVGLTVCLHTYIHTYIHVYMCVCVCVYIYVYAYMQTTILTRISDMQVGWTPRDEPLSDVYSPTGTIVDDDDDEEALDYADPRSAGTQAPTQQINNMDAYAYTSVDAAPNFGGNTYQDTRENGWWGAGNGGGNVYANEAQSAYVSQAQGRYGEQDVVYDDEYEMDDTAVDDNAYADRQTQDAYHANAGGSKGANFGRGQVVYDDVDVGGAEEFGNANNHGMSSPPKYDFDESVHVKKGQNMPVHVAEEEEEDDDDVAWA